MFDQPSGLLVVLLRQVVSGAVSQCLPGTSFSNLLLVRFGIIVSDLAPVLNF
jgi:hypothetical protein